MVISNEDFVNIAKKNDSPRSLKLKVTQNDPMSGNHDVDQVDTSEARTPK